MLAAPAVVNQIRKNEEKAKEAGYKLVYMATLQHVTENRVRYPKGRKYCIPIQTLIDEGRLVSPVKEINTGKTIDTYQVLVYLFSSGTVSYEGPMESSDCSMMESLPMIDFVINPLNNVWSKSKDVTIIYPSDSTERKFKKNDGAYNDYNNDTVNYTEIGKLSARAKYNDQLIESKIDILNIDPIAPKIQYTENKCKLKITLTDEGGSGLKDYAISNNANITGVGVSEWKSISKTNKKILNEESYTNKKYIYARDNVGNSFTKTYNPAPHTLSFNLNGGSGTAPSNQTVYNGGYYNQNSALPTASRSGYTFAGWYTAASGGSKIENTTKVCLNGNQTLYAHWNGAATCKITYDVNGGSGRIADTTCSCNTDCTLASASGISKTGHTFAGWHTAATGGTKYGSTVKITSNITVHAHWNINTYKITYNGNGHTSGSMADTTCSYNTDCTLSGNKFEKKCYKFAGWYTAASGGTKYGSTVKITSNKVVYAHWTVDKAYKNSKGNCYNKIENAIGETPNKGTIYLLKNHSDATAASLDEDKSLTFDGGGHSLTLTKSAINISAGTMTVKNGKIETSSLKASAIDVSGGTLNIETGATIHSKYVIEEGDKFDYNNPHSQAIYITGGTVNLNGGKISAGNGEDSIYARVLLMNQGTKVEKGKIVNTTGTFNMNSGTVSADARGEYGANGINSFAGRVNLNGGKVYTRKGAVSRCSVCSHGGSIKVKKGVTIEMYGGKSGTLLYAASGGKICYEDGVNFTYNKKKNSFSGGSGQIIGKGKKEEC